MKFSYCNCILGSIEFTNTHRVSTLERFKEKSHRLRHKAVVPRTELLTGRIEFIFDQGDQL